MAWRMSARVVSSLLGTSSASGRRIGTGHDHRSGRVALSHHVQEGPEPFADHAGAVRDPGPAALAVGDGDDLGGEGGDVLGGDDLAATGAGVAQVDQVQPGLPGRDGGPALGWARGDPALGGPVPVGEPPGEGRGRGDLALDRGQGQDHRLHALGQVDDGRLVGWPRTEGQPDEPVAEDGFFLAHLAAAAPHREGDAGAVAAVAEVAGRGAVGDVDGLGVADQLETDADRDAGRTPHVGGQPGRVGGVGPGVRDVAGGGIGRSPDEGFGLLGPRAHRSLASIELPLSPALLPLLVVFDHNIILRAFPTSAQGRFLSPHQAGTGVRTGVCSMARAHRSDGPPPPDDDPLIRRGPAPRMTDQGRGGWCSRR